MTGGDVSLSWKAGLARSYTSEVPGNVAFTCLLNGMVVSWQTGYHELLKMSSDQ